MAVELSIKRNLKRSRLFEIQKITKRMKLLEKRSGTDSQLKKNERKRMRLLEELELIKDINLNNLVKEIAKDDSLLHLLEKNPPADLQVRARWRLLSSKAMQQKPLKLKNKRQQNKNSTTSQPCFDLQESDGVEQSLDGNKTFQIHVRVSSDDSERSSADEGTAPPRDRKSVRGTGSRRSAKLTYKSETSSSLSDSDRAESDEVVVSSGLSHTVLGTESMFVGSLGGECSIKIPKVQQKKKTNRLGQRTRRKQWEKMYGTTAKHVSVEVTKKSFKANRSRHSDEKRGIQESRRKGVVRDHAKSTDHADEQLLHPSWAASKRRKEQESSTMQFLGQKTVFRFRSRLEEEYVSLEHVSIN